MHPEFTRAVESLHPSFESLLATEPARAGCLPATMPRQGVYLFTEKRCHLYVGRSNNIRARYGGHCNPGATHKTAAFAFQLAREATGRTEASYKPGRDSRAGLMLDSEFAVAFDGAKTRIRSMDFRFVNEADQTRQALLEIYCAIALGTPYNDFGTH